MFRSWPMPKIRREGPGVGPGHGGGAMPRKRLAVMLIGAGGNMRNAHVPRIAADGAVEIVGVADPAESQARLLMDRAAEENGPVRVRR